MSGKPKRDLHYPGRRVVTSRDLTPRTTAFPLTGLVSYWTLDEASGTRVDSVGTNHLTPTNAPVGAAGKIGNGCDFEASSSQYLSHADPTPLGDENFTYALWFKRESMGVPGILIGKDVAAGRSYVVGATDVGTIEFYFGPATVYVQVGVPSDTNWHFVVAWHDAAANTIQVQTDNAGIASVPTGGIFPTPSATPVFIGARQFAGAEAYFDGLIDEVALWRRVLTAQERTDLWNNGDGVTYATVMDVYLTDRDYDVLTPYSFASEILPFRIRVDPAVYYHTGYYYEHVATDASGLWIYAPTR